MNRRGVCAWLLGGVCATAVFSGVVLGKAGVVKTREGQTYTGDIEEKDAETVIVKSGSGIATPIPRARIASLEYTADFEAGFRERLGKLGPQDVAGRLQLAREAFDARQYPLARDAAEAARQIDPNNTDAAAMLDTVQSQIRLERTRQQQPGAAPGDPANGGAATAGAGGGGGSGAATQPADLRVLRPEQINAVRQSELRPEDVGVRVRFERDVLKRYMQHQSLQPANMNIMSVEQKVQDILEKGTPEMRRDVTILSDPPAMFQYRRNVQPFVLQNCATAGCHGTVNPAKFALISPGDADAAAYTNFYVLNQYTKPARNDGNTGGGNPFGPGELRMIDRQRPEQSLLLQYGLPGAISDHDHPDVPGYRPPFRGLNDARYRQLLTWVGESLVAVPRDYGFTFGGQPTTGAATQPSTQPAPAAEATAAATLPARPARPMPPTRPAPQPRTPAPAPAR